MEIRLDSLEAYIDEKVKEAFKDIKQGFIEAMISEIIKLQTYKMFPYEETVYVERDEVLRIFDKYTVKSEDKDGTD